MENFGAIILVVCSLSLAIKPLKNELLQNK